MPDKTKANIPAKKHRIPPYQKGNHMSTDYDMTDVYEQTKGMRLVCKAHYTRQSPQGDVYGTIYGMERRGERRIYHYEDSFVSRGHRAWNPEHWLTADAMVRDSYCVDCTEAEGLRRLAERALSCYPGDDAAVVAFLRELIG